MHKEFLRHSDKTDRAVLFVHGILGSPLHFTKFIDRLDKDVAVQSLLLKGHGGSVKDFSRASMSEWKKQTADAVEALLKRYDKIVIVGHSMGTFFAIDEAIKHKDRVESVCLLQTAMCIHIMPTAVKHSFKALFGLVDEKDETTKAYIDSHSITLNKKLWQYLGWIPRIAELSKESKTARQRIKELEVPCVVFLSQKDELVSMKSAKYIPKKENIKLHILTKSAHFIYDKDDEQKMIDEFLNLLA